MYQVTNSCTHALAEWDRLVLLRIVARDYRGVRNRLSLASTEFRHLLDREQEAVACERMIDILGAIIRLDALAIQSGDIGHLASAVRDDLSALPALLDALEEAGRDEERRVVAALGDTGVVA